MSRYIYTKIKEPNTIYVRATRNQKVVIIRKIYRRVIFTETVYPKTRRSLLAAASRVSLKPKPL